MRFYFLFLVAFLASNLLRAQSLSQASRPLPDEVIQAHYFSDSRSIIPNFIEFTQTSSLNEDEAIKWLIGQYGLKHSKFISKPSEGAHHRYQQYYKGYKVETGDLVLHTKNKLVHSISGTPKNISSPVNPAISEKEALSTALSHSASKKYIWESPTQRFLYPKGKLVWKENINKQFRLCWKFDIYSTHPLNRSNYFIDANTGEIVDKIPTMSQACLSTHETGTANTYYSEIREIETDFYNGQYRLRDYTRGNGIETYNMSNGTNTDLASDFSDDDNFWDDSIDNVAYDAHWGAEMTYDYYLDKFNKNSLDGQGFVMISYVHYDDSLNNAFWDGNATHYGDGSLEWSKFRALTALDVVAHEFTHGVTEFSAGLIYRKESGALNEAFSDIFGALIEFYARPENANWEIGEDSKINGNPIRRISDPKSMNDPDTYGGEFWDSIDEEVHINSQVGAYWFYLLSEGGNDTNDKGTPYTIQGLGKDSAARIAYHTLNNYLTSTSDYEAARFLSIQATVDLYGACTNEVEQVTNAWNAVGVGPKYQPIVTANFSADTFACSLPARIKFQNKSLNASNFVWDFGDGNSSTSHSPIHYYEDFNTYSVQLIADGGVCGKDTLTITDLISVQEMESCPIKIQTDLNDTTSACSGELTDDGGLFQNYSNNATGSFTIKVPEAEKITLTIHEFDLQSGFDYLNVFDGDHIDSTIIGQYSGSILPNDGFIQSSGNAITIQLETDAYTSSQGFLLEWQCISNNLPPSAYLAGAPTYSCNGNVAFVNKSIGNIDLYEWKFGDGQTSTSANPSHTYSKDSSYSVQLKVCNSFGCDSIQRKDYITVDTTTGCSKITALPKNGVGAIQTTCNGTIYDSGENNDYHNLSEGLMTISPINATNVKLTFHQFGFEDGYDYLEIFDGPGTESPLIGAYTGFNIDSGFSITSSGPSVTLKQNTDNYVTDIGFKIGWTCAINTDSPTAQFEVFPKNSCTGTVRYTNQSLGSTESWYWDFGDGESSTTENPEHNYTESGFYDISFKTCNAFGCDSIYAENAIYINLEAIDCETTLNMPASGSEIIDACFGRLFDNGGADSNYTNNTAVILTIAPSGASAVHLNFIDLQTEMGWDFINIYDGPDRNSPSLGSFSGINPPSETISSSSGVITIEQLTDNESNLAGFELIWFCDEITTGIIKQNNTDLEIYPNPAFDAINYAISSESTMGTITIVNSTGEVILRQQTSAPTGRLNASQLTPGIYSLQFLNEKIKLTQKLIVH